MASKTLVRRVAGASSVWRAVSRVRPEPLRLAPIFAPLQSRFTSSNARHSEDRAPYEKSESVGNRALSQFDISGKVFIVTGGGRGLGLCLAQGLVEAGGRVHCLDRLEQPDPAFGESAERLKREVGGELIYHRVDVTDNDALETVIADIGAERQRLDGLIAAAAIQQVTPALDYASADIAKMLSVNYTGVFLSARACARQMHKYKIQGSICLIASMSGTIANRGFIAPVYNSSKAAVVQLAKNLAMEWGRMNPDGSGGIRVNAISPGHIMTPMVEENFRRGEASKEEWENNNMLGRLSRPDEYKAAALFLLSRASSYMTGSNVIIDGGTTAW
ncbi:NAD(P)-binding protein [Paraphaeosphaeria sporulosa]|uniref:NAD(P)-binding protein n=1 Tax=Paraphaeosphaeria sporulosa TaxID=1460663 RepID=A0A177CY29_9PLEO|nr:NAD(P)-binding protein [Paraphaeosphaeria sporulosa]OAG12443.1 NAD(P)-binding protein [Paraphaeosphaeria sporulosa]